MVGIVAVIMIVVVRGVVIVNVMRIGHASSSSMDLATVTTLSKRRATAKPTDGEDKTNLPCLGRSTPTRLGCIGALVWEKYLFAHLPQRERIFDRVLLQKCRVSRGDMQSVDATLPAP